MMKKLDQLLQNDTAAICYEKGRMVGSAGHEEARRHLLGRLLEIGCEPFVGNSIELPYEGGGQSFCNLVGLLPGTNPALAPVLVGAHYDSVIPHPCADDNAAAVAIALQVGRMLSEQERMERGVVIALFDAEEPPYFLGEQMGSNRFFADHVAGRREIHAAVVMDLVGHDISVPAEILGSLAGAGQWAKQIPGLAGMDVSVPLLKNTVFISGSESHVDLPVALERLGQPSGLRVMPTLNRYIGDMSDHAVFRRNGVPYWFLSCGRWAHYHMPTDTPDRLNYHKMAAIASYVVDLVREAGRSPLAGRTGEENVHDPIAMESAFVREALGVLYHPTMQWMGLEDVSTRRRMGAFVRKLEQMI